VDAGGQVVELGDGVRPEFVDVDVPGGKLRTARWGDGGQTVLGIHGVTASSLSLAPVARHLAEHHHLLAPDLRGRGASGRLPGPFGMEAHARDCAEVLEALGSGPAVVVGESMGGYVAVVLAARFPERVERLVLVDGGLPPPLSPGLDPGAVVEAVLGPALARLGTVFGSEAEYLDFWRAHPSFTEGLSDDIEAYLLYDLEPVAGGFRSRVSEAAVREDSAQTLQDPEVITDALNALRCPISLLRAERGLLNQSEPLLPEAVVAEWRSVLPQLVDEIVPDTNHYTLMFGATGAAEIARLAFGTGPDRSSLAAPSAQPGGQHV